VFVTKVEAVSACVSIACQPRNILQAKVCLYLCHLTGTFVPDADVVLYVKGCLTVDFVSDAEGVGESMYMSRRSDTTNLIQYKLS
jgi:hypothetical protein